MHNTQLMKPKAKWKICIIIFLLLFYFILFCYTYICMGAQCERTKAWKIYILYMCVWMWRCWAGGWNWIGWMGDKKQIQVQQQSKKKSYYLLVVHAQWLTISTIHPFRQGSETKKRFVVFVRGKEQSIVVLLFCELFGHLVSELR